MKDSDTRRPGHGRPRSRDARQDRRIVRATVDNRTASREEIRAYIAPSVLLRIIGNRKLAKDSHRVCFGQATTYTTTPPSTATLVS